MSETEINSKNFPEKNNSTGFSNAEPIWSFLALYIKLSFLSLIACLLFSILTVKTSFAETEVEKEIERINKEGMKLYHEGKYGEALPLFEKLVEFRRNNLGEEHPSYATSLNNLAALYMNMGA